MNIWPLTAEPAVSVGGVSLTEIAERFGTPAYVVDEEHVPDRSSSSGSASSPESAITRFKTPTRAAAATKKTTMVAIRNTSDIACARRQAPGG
jgi:hypothetical protein